MDNLTKLQIQITHLERFVDQINDVVTEQATTIDLLKRQINKLQDNVQSIKTRLPENESSAEDDVPPHY